MTDSQTGTVDAALQHEWYRAVAKVLARSRKQDPADVPDDAWTSLIQHTYDQIDVNPLYTRADQAAEVSAPGEYPFTRGDHSADGATGWGVRERFSPAEFDGADAKNLNTRILDALTNGTTHIELAGLTPADLPVALENVYLDLAPLALAEADDALGTAVLDLVAEQPAATVELGAQPLTAPVDSTTSVNLDTALAWAARAAQAPGDVRAITVNAVSFHNQGGSDSQNIGLALAAGVEYLRLLTDAGLSAEQAAAQLAFRLPTSDDFFASIASFRAFRTLWARVLEVVGVADAALPPVTAETAPAMFTQRDPYVNMLRCTVAAFAAGVGGASSVLVHPFDYAIPGGLEGTRRSFAHRIARNTNLLLLEESHLGHVIDPAGGSYYVEALTDQLADKAWEVFTTIEANGGFSAQRDAGAVQTLLDATYEARRVDIAFRRTSVTAINEFPNLLEAPLPAAQRVEPTGVRRYGADFEALRNRSDAFLEATGARPTMHLVPLGPLAKHNIRTGFTSNLLASGGIASVNPGQVDPAADTFADTFKDAKIAVICGTDPEYAESAGAAVDALRAAGVGKILLAGAPKAVAELPEASQPDGYLNMKIDAVTTLSGLLDELGA